LNEFCTRNTLLQTWTKYTKPAPNPVPTTNTLRERWAHSAQLVVHCSLSTTLRAVAMAQLTAEQLAEIEAACELCSTGIGPQRAEAERFVVGLRSAENAVDMAQFIIVNSQSEHTCFHAAIMLKEATLRDWHKLAPEQRNSIKGNLLLHVVGRGISLKNFVRQPLLQVIFLDFPLAFPPFSSQPCSLPLHPSTPPSLPDPLPSSLPPSLPPSLSTSPLTLPHDDSRMVDP